MRRANTIVAKACLAWLIWGMAYAVSAEGITTSFSGYGTAAGTFTSDGHYSYIHNASEFTGASNSLDVGLDSRVGVQAIVSFDSHWSVTVQEAAKLRGSTKFDPGTEWLYAQYQSDSDVKLRVGRVVLPAFLVSDTINVGYAVPWVNAPNEVYGSEPFDYLDGAQAMWQHSLGPLTLNLEASYGATEATFQVFGFQLVAKSSNTFNGAVSLSWRNLLLRYAETDLNTTATVPLSATVTESFMLKDRFHCLGFQYDDGRALVMSEFARRDENNLPGLNKPIGAENVWYAAAGWRVGKFMPMAVYSVFDLKSSAISPTGSHATWTGILRYDVVRDLDLKLQITRPQADNGIYWTNPNGVQKRVNVYSFGADFVF